jgi:hypothetical protein
MTATESFGAAVWLGLGKMAADAAPRRDKILATGNRRSIGRQDSLRVDRRRREKSVGGDGNGGQQRG